MSSLGFQTIYRQINQHSSICAERAFLPDAPYNIDDGLVSYESRTPVANFPVIALSVAYEIELAGVIDVLRLAGIAPLASERDERAPFILGGGPLTFSNPLPLAPYVDAILLGEADESIHQAIDILYGPGDRKSKLIKLAESISSCYVPSLHGDRLTTLGKCENSQLPAFSQIFTPNTELRDMFLIEAARGCSRGCEYCVMRRSTNGGMRIVPKEKILSLVPEHAKRVGLVGAAVSDHPKIVEIVNELADQGKGVGLSSLRPDKLSSTFVAALKRAGYKTLTTASDGASQRLRERIERKAQEKHLRNAAEVAREHALKRLKIYMMVGLPDENNDDIDELVGFSTELSKRIPLSLGIAAFVSKRNTPLDNMPFAGIKTVEERLARLRKGVRGRVDVRATSARWAWVEYRLAQGAIAEGRAVYDAVQRGGRFSDWKDALNAVEAAKPKRTLVVV